MYNFTAFHKGIPLIGDHFLDKPVMKINYLTIITVDLESRK